MPEEKKVWKEGNWLNYGYTEFKAYCVSCTELGFYLCYLILKRYFVERDLKKWKYGGSLSSGAEVSK